MRPDFNKLLVERPRPGSSNKFGATRHSKQLNASTDQLQIGGRESMRRRHKISGDHKVFNENLNPLKNWLHSKLGKKWDKTYSELRQTFDARGVINNHILEHLFDYVEIHTKVVDNVVMVLDGYNGSKGYVPLKRKFYAMRFPEYYVCPKDGTLKTMHRPSRRSIAKQAEANKKKELAAKFRDLGDGRHLHLEDDGVWYVYDVSKLPKVVKEYVPISTRDYLYTVNQRWQKPMMKTWDEMNGAERQQHGKLVVIEGLVTDARSGELVCAEPYLQGYQGRRRFGGYSYGQPTLGRSLYYSSKKQASHKVLKEAGVDGSATFDESKVVPMSHREAAKYR